MMSINYEHRTWRLHYAVQINLHVFVLLEASLPFSRIKPILTIVAKIIAFVCEFLPTVFKDKFDIDLISVKIISWTYYICFIPDLEYVVFLILLMNE
jgi:hypothetical protein